MTPALPPPDAAAGVPRPARLRLEAAGVGAALLVLYAATRSANLALAHDSLFYLADIASGEPARLFHAHHLLYPSAGAAWLAAARALGVAAEAAYVVATLSALAGAATGAVAYLLLRLRARADAATALAGTLGLAGSFGAWFYSGSVEVYLLPLPFLLGALGVLAGGAPGPPSGRRAAAAGALLGLGVLGHEAHALFGLPLLVLVWTRAPGRAALRQALALAGAAAAVVLPATAAVLLLAVRPASAGEAAAWAAGYAAGDRFWHAPGPATLLKAAASLVRSVTGLHAALAVPALREAAARAFSPGALADEVLLVRRMPPALGVALTAGAAAAWAGLLALLVIGWRHRRHTGRAADPLARALLAWLAVYAAFFVTWDPQNVEFWIPQAMVLWLLAATLVARRRSRRMTAALGVTAALVLVVNLFGSILPAADPAGDACRARIGRAAGRAGPGDLVLTPRVHLAGPCARYLLGADAAVVGPDTDAAALRAWIASVHARGGRVFVLAEVAGSAGLARVLGPLAGGMRPAGPGLLRLDGQRPFR